MSLDIFIHEYQIAFDFLNSTKNQKPSKALFSKKLFYTNQLKKFKALIRGYGCRNTVSKLTVQLHNLETLKTVEQSFYLTNLKDSDSLTDLFTLILPPHLKIIHYIVEPCQVGISF